MTIELTIANHQRKVQIDSLGLRQTMSCLCDELCKSLLTTPAKGLSRRFVIELQQKAVLSVVLVSNRKIRQLNKLWRFKDKATDVLSFSLSFQPPPVGQPWEVGEIVISLEKAKEQAAIYGHSFDRELAFLFVHGLLHILGFDHQTEVEKKEMFARQNEILKAAGFSR